TRLARSAGLRPVAAHPQRITHGGRHRWTLGWRASRRWWSRRAREWARRAPWDSLPRAPASRCARAVRPRSTRPPPRSAPTRRRREWRGGGGLAGPAAVSGRVAPARVAGRAAEGFGRGDVLVASVGGPPPGPFDQLSDEHWKAAFEQVHLSTVRFIREVLPHM